MRLATAALAVMALHGVGVAAAAERAYLAPVAGAGLAPEDSERVTRAVRDALAGAGFVVVGDAGGADPARLEACAAEPGCIAEWGRAAGVGWVVRVAATRIDELTIALEAVEVASAARRDAVAERVTLGPEADSGLLAAARALRPEPARVRGRTRRIAGWTLLGVGAVSAGLALWALSDSNDAEHEFDRHLDAQGNVVGLTPAAAHALEDRARSGRLLGASTAALAAVAVAGGVGLLLWPRSQERSLAVAPLPERGASAVVTQRF